MTTAPVMWARCGRCRYRIAGECEVWQRAVSAETDATLCRVFEQLPATPAEVVRAGIEAAGQTASVIVFDREQAQRIAAARRLEEEASRLLDRDAPSAETIREAVLLKERARKIRAGEVASGRAP